MSVSSSDPDPLADFTPLAEQIAAAARETPNRVAAQDETQALTYRELDALMDRVGAALQRDRVGDGATIAICGETSLAYLATFLGALRVGVAVAPLPPSATPASLAAMLADCEARALFVDATTQALFDRPSIRLDDGFADWLAPDGARPTAVEIRPEAVFNTIYSSGTTGAPKGIDQSHAMRFLHTRRRLVAGYDAETSTLISTPLYSNTTLVSVFPTLAAGGRRHPDAEIRRPPLSGDRGAGARHPCDAGAGAIRAADGVARVRPLRSLKLPHEACDQRPVRRRLETGRADALAGRARRILRHDRGRRDLHPHGARKAGQTAYGRPAGGRSRREVDRRRGPRGWPPANSARWSGDRPQ